MKQNTKSKKFDIITASEARGRLLIGNQIVLRKVEKDIIKSAERGHDCVVVNYVIDNDSLSYLRSHGYKAEVCYDETSDVKYGTLISWK